MATAITNSPRDHGQKHEEKIETADPHPKPGLFGGLKEIYYEFSNDDVMTQSAALAFYSGLAFAPLMTVAVWLARMFFGPDSKMKVVDAFQQVIGPQAAGPLKQLLDPASQQASSGMTAAGIISLVLVIFSASGVFGQVQTALNAIWHVEAKPSSGFKGFIQKRLLSMGMLMCILFLLMVSLVLSTVIQGVVGTSGDDTSIVIDIVQNVVSVGVFTALFALLFKYVPDAKISWRPTWMGGFISAVLFVIGKFGLSIYLGRGSYENSYGVAVGSFVALLVWVYYSAIILLVGAEATEVYARRHGEGLKPSEHAVRVEKKTEPA